MKEITRKVFSLCQDFDEKMARQISDEITCDVYIDWTANTEETLRKEGYDVDPVAVKLVELGAADGEKILIHVDY